MVASHLREQGVELTVTATDGTQRTWWAATAAIGPWPLPPDAVPPPAA